MSILEQAPRWALAIRLLRVIFVFPGREKLFPVPVCRGISANGEFHYSIGRVQADVHFFQQVWLCNAPEIYVLPDHEHD